MKTEIIINGKSTEVCSLIEPMRYKNKMYLEMDLNVTGFKDSECFLYIGPPEPDFSHREENTVVKAGDMTYNVARASRIALHGDTVYLWAVLTPRIKDGEYGIL